MSSVRTILILLFVIVLSSCESRSQESIKITFEPNNMPIIIRLAKDNPNRIIAMQIPNRMVIENSSNFDETYIKVYYKYNENIPLERRGAFGINLFEVDDNDHIKKLRNGRNIVKAKSVKKIDFLSAHFIDSSKSVQVCFKPYLEEMLALGKDTLHIMNINDFKTKNSSLFKKLTNNDSIAIQFLNDKKLGERITIPIKW